MIRTSLQVDDVMLRFSELRSDAALPRPINLCIGTSAFDASAFFEAPLALDPSWNRYVDTAGLPELRRALSDHYAAKGIHISPERFLVTDGALGALTVSLASLLETGDEVLIPELCFPPYPQLIELFHGRAVRYPLQPDGQIDVAGLRRKVGPKTKAIIVNSPGNPSGSIATKEILSAVAELGVRVISDEVYDAFCFDEPPVSLLEVTEDHFVVNSLSKSFCFPALRVGYIVVPKAFGDIAWNIKAAINICTSAPAQKIATGLLQRAPAFLRAHRDYLSGCRDFFFRETERLGLHVRGRPRGGFYALLDTSAIGDKNKALCLDLVEKSRVAVFPGADFAGEDEPGFVRINYASDAATVREGLERIARHFAEKGAKT